MEVKLIAYPRLANGINCIEGCTEADSVVVYAISQCYRSKPNVNSIRKCFDRGHHSVFEHINFTFQVKGISRSCLAQLTRHRLAAYSVESQRYCDYTKKDVDFVVPYSIVENADLRKESDSKLLICYLEFFDNAKTLYNDLRAIGVSPEDARFILPEATATNLIFTMNARELFHCFNLRIDSHAQWEIRELFKNVLQLVLKVAPITFEEYKNKLEV